MSSNLNSIVQEITESIEERSKKRRQKYLELMAKNQSDKPSRAQMGCTNLAHVQAASSENEKLILKDTSGGSNIAIVTSYNDMLSAHQPYYRYPEMLKAYLYPFGISAQVAGGVPAMCDGVTQGQSGMELSLFSRDTIALGTAVAMSHQAFDGMMLLGICDKIVPGLLMGALRFGHLPGIFVPAGPMPSGITNDAKAKVRQAHVKGEATNAELLDSESAAYHSAGTCTFYGTANSNQMLLEAMGLMLPGSAFVQPNDDQRTGYNQWACESLAEMCRQPKAMSFSQLVNEKTIVNALVALLATGGSTNLTIHWIAVAQAAGIEITWDDIQTLSSVVPLICKVYPNGPHDINQFHEAGGTAWVFSQLLEAGLMHGDVLTVSGEPFCQYAQRIQMQQSKPVFEKAYNKQESILSSTSAPFDETGGLVQVEGNLGRAVIKVSAVPRQYWNIKAPAKVFSSQLDVAEAYKNGELSGDFVLVLKGQGPKSNGMPELHKLMPILGNLQDAGNKVALLTDGRLSGASGKVLSAIHLVPEAANEGFISQLLDGDIIEIDVETKSLAIHDVDFSKREKVYEPAHQMGVGRELFALFRNNVTPADKGAVSINWDE